MNKLCGFVLGLLLIFVASAGVADRYAQVTEDGYGAVATVHPLATDAAMEAYREGGNAVDALVAAAYALGVVDSNNSGIGGGAFIVIRWANGDVEAIDGRETAPAAATRNMFVRDGKAVSDLSRNGPLAVGVPGSVMALEYVHQKGGKTEFADVLQPGILLADKGFIVEPLLARRVALTAHQLLRYEGRHLLFDEQRKPINAGDVLIQKELAAVYRALAENGADYFYKGGFAEQVAEWMQANGGIITKQDFSNYSLKLREPVRTRFGDYELVGFPPPSSGGVHVAQILSVLADVQWAELPLSERYHVLSEAMQIAFADRAHWLGDPDFAKVPKGLVHPKYLASLVERVNAEKASDDIIYGSPFDYSDGLFSRHTTHIATADKDGNWVAMTTTLNTAFGSKVVVPGTGVFLNNQMDDFSAQPGVPNTYGLVGAEANAVAPGKRPLSSMSPTLVLRQGKPVMTVGAAGGPTIITQVVQAVANHLLLDKPLPEALAIPRVHHQWRPEILYVEPTMPKAVTKGLREKGHGVKALGAYGATQAISIDEDGEFVAVSEPRLKQRNR